MTFGLLSKHVNKYIIELNALFARTVYSGAECCPLPLETVGIRVPALDVTFLVSSSHCPSARCSSAANAICKAVP
jgi:hypothetical protein